LKGTVAHALTGHSFICLPDEKNLNGFEDLLVRLKANGAIEVLEAFDMNKLTEKQASESAAKLRDMVSSCGLK